MADVQISKEILDRVRRRSRLGQIENILQHEDLPTDEDIVVAMYDALTEINASGDYGSNFTMEIVLNRPDYLYTCELGAAKNIVNSLYTHFAHSGFDLSTSDLVGYQIKDLTGSLSALYGTLSSEFTSRIDRLKAATIRKARVAQGNTNNPMSSYSSRKVIIY